MTATSKPAPTTINAAAILRFSPPVALLIAAAGAAALGGYAWPTQPPAATPPPYALIAEPPQKAYVLAWGAFGLAGLLSLFAVCCGVLAMISVRPLRLLADATLDASRSDAAAPIWGRERSDAIGVIARTVEYMHWQRVEAAAATAASTLQTHVDAIESASVKASRQQDALSRSVAAVTGETKAVLDALKRVAKDLEDRARRPSAVASAGQFEHILDSLDRIAGLVEQAPETHADPAPVVDDRFAVAMAACFDEASALRAELSDARSNADAVHRAWTDAAQTLSAAPDLAEHADRVAQAADQLAANAAALPQPGPRPDVFDITEVETAAQRGVDAVLARYLAPLDHLQTLHATVDDRFSALQAALGKTAPAPAAPSDADAELKTLISAAHDAAVDAAKVARSLLRHGPPPAEISQPSPEQQAEPARQTPPATGQARQIMDAVSMISKRYAVGMDAAGP